jgi:hypothetical protein
MSTKSIDVHSALKDHPWYLNLAAEWLSYHIVQPRGGHQGQSAVRRNIVSDLKFAISLHTPSSTSP